MRRCWSMRPIRREFRIWLMICPRAFWFGAVDDDMETRSRAVDSKVTGVDGGRLCPIEIYRSVTGYFAQTFKGADR